MGAPNGLDRRRLIMSTAAASMLAACGDGGDPASPPPPQLQSPSPSPSPPSPPPGVLPDPSTAPALKTFFAAHFKIGMAVDPGLAPTEPTYGVLSRHANSLTAENVMKAYLIGVGPGVYNFTQADQLIAFAQANNIAVRGHNLVWHQTSPAWFFAGDQSDWPAYQALVRQRLVTYITDVVTHFKGKVYCWDVVNEPTSDDPAYVYRQSLWHQVLGPSYIATALEAARAADPTVQLFLNDYSTEDPAKRARLMQIVDDVQAAKAPLDGIGHQLHINIDYPTAAAVDQALTDTEAKGLINHVTELDVSLYQDPQSCFSGDLATCLPALTPGTPEMTAALQKQALQYRAMYDVFVRHSSLKAVTTWGVADNHTAFDTFPVTAGRLNLPLLFDQKGLPKSAFWAVVDPSFTP
jgi:endo-1,4-beta-xylanase